jgi:hypothetical protein
METCHVDGCTRSVSKAGYELCLDHWKAQRLGKVPRCPTCGHLYDASARHTCVERPAGRDEDDAEPVGGMLTSTRIGKHFNFSSVKTNLILAELVGSSVT